MAMTSIIRRAAVPFAARVIGRTQRSSSPALFSTVANRTIASRSFFRSPVPSAFRCYSNKPASDAALLQVIDSEIKCAEESDDHDKVDEVPEGFPFEIEDHPGKETVTLTRQYQGETINVDVHISNLISGMEEEAEEDGPDNDGSDNDGGIQSRFPFVVSVSKNDDGPWLEFGCTAMVDEIEIDSLSIKDPNAEEDDIAYEGPVFSDLDENLQKAFYKYLEIRGIKPSTTNFMHEYMINKDSREYLLWIKNLKKFIEA